MLGHKDPIARTALRFFGMIRVVDNSGMKMMLTFAEFKTWH
jgi:hypothetical protein